MNDPGMPVRRPRDETLKAVVEYLEALGLSVYGAYRDRKSEAFEAEGGCMDYDIKDIIRLRNLRDPR